MRDVKLSLAGPADSMNWTLSGDDGGIVEIAGTGRAWHRQRHARARHRLARRSASRRAPGGCWHRPRSRSPIPRVLVSPFRLQGTDGSGYISIAGTRAVDRSRQPRGRGTRALDARPVGAGAVRHGGDRAVARFPGAHGRHALGPDDGRHDRDGRRCGWATRAGRWRRASSRTPNSGSTAACCCTAPGSPVMQMRYSLPLDLALQGVKERLVPGPLSIQATADSVP